jgi:hypothetical protein
VERAIQRFADVESHVVGTGRSNATRECVVDAKPSRALYFERNSPGLSGSSVPLSSLEGRGKVTGQRELRGIDDVEDDHVMPARAQRVDRAPDCLGSLIAIGDEYENAGALREYARRRPIASTS